MGVYNLPSQIGHISANKISRVTEDTGAVNSEGNLAPLLGTDNDRAYFIIYNSSEVDVYLDFSTASSPVKPTKTHCSYVLKPGSTYFSDIPYYTGKVVAATDTESVLVIWKCFYES